MIVVTGSCRTGTSLMMQTLKGMGVPIVGQAFHDDFSHIDLNPWGYWELPIAETINGFNTDKHYGHAVKLFGLQFFRTNARFIESVIVCLRKKEDAVNSTIKLLEKNERITGLKPTTANAKSVYDSNYKLIDMAIRGLPYLCIDFNDMLENKDNNIDAISEFLSEKAGIRWQQQQQ